MKKFAVALLALILALCFAGCSITGSDEASTGTDGTDAEQYTDKDGDVLYFTPSEELAVIYLNTSDNLILCTLEDGVVTSSAYAYCYTNEEAVSTLYESAKETIDTSLYSEVYVDGLYLIYVYAEDNADCLNGLTVAQLELLYGENVLTQ